MIIENLSLKNYRNYSSASVDLSSEFNVISGANAQGKTNLLESMVYLSLSKSHRTNDDSLLIKHGCEYAKISCRFKSGVEKNISALIRSAGKTLMIENQPVLKSSAFIGQLNVVLFAPDDLRIFEDQPRERRRMMNQEISKISNRYLISLNNYQGLLRQRNILLKQKKIDMNYLDTLDEQMIKEEVKIIHSRRVFVEEINQLLPDIYQKLSTENIKSKMVYHCCIDNSESAEELNSMLKSAREKDMETGTTTSGIHREDLSFTMDGRNLIETASQGQRRMMMLAYKMALLQFIQKISKDTPILLLDDVLSELDIEHQKRLISMVHKPCQCIITCTEIPAFLKEQNAAEYYIENGTIAVQKRGTL